MFALFRQQKQRKKAAASLYRAAVDQARAPAFYRAHGVPDTVDGRFELILLHVFVLCERLRAISGAGPALAQALFDVMFRDMDRALRNIGVGDLAVPHHIRRMMKGFNGRAHVYHEAFSSGVAGVAKDVLRRNLFGTVECPEEKNIIWFENYMRRNLRALSAQDDRNFIEGGIVRFEGLNDGEEKDAKSAAA